MDSHAVPVLSLFEKKMRLEVPLFQRQYVWTREKHWEPLWEDIHRKFAEYVSGMRDRPLHFLGAMVLDQKMTPATSVDKRQVIDGQQRLTTLQIFLAALRDFCRKEGFNEHADELANLTHNKGMMSDPTVDKYKVWPTKSDRHQFTSVIDLGSVDAVNAAFPVKRQKYARKDDPRPPMVEAYLYFSAAIGEFFNGAGDEPPLAADRPLKDRLSDALLALTNALRVVSIDLDKDDDAQVIFETLNARGEPLLPADLLRNYIFLRAGRNNEDQEQLYAKYWSPFDEQFWRDEVRQGRLIRPRSDLFMQHFLSSRRGEDVPIKHLFVEYRHWIVKDRPFTSVLQELETISRNGANFRRVLDPIDGDPVAPLSRFMESFDIRTAYPLMLVLMEADLSPEEWKHVSDSMESYLLRRTVVGLPTKAYNRIFLNLAATLRATGATPERLRTALSILEGETSVWPSDETFTAAWMNENQYHRLNLAKLQHLFVRLNEKLINRNTEDVRFTGNLTVEHLMPQDWIEHWPLPDGSSGETDSEKLWGPPPRDARTEATLARDRIKHTIGNLTLLTQSLNSSVGNGPWELRKPKVLEYSILALNQRLNSYQNWDESTIRARGKELLDAALQLWPGPHSLQKVPAN
jgi:hypothetical protein